MHKHHKIVIKKRNYTRPKRLFYHGQKTRMIYPYLHKKDDKIEVIAPVPEEDLNNTAQHEASTHAKPSKAAVIDSNASRKDNKVTDSAIEHHENVNAINQTHHQEGESVKDNAQNETPVVVHKETRPASTVDTNETRNSNHQTDEVDSKHYEPQETTHTTVNNNKKASWLTHLPKILMGTLVGLLLGILLMSLFNSKQPNTIKKEQKVQTVEQSIQKNMNNVVSVTNLQKANDPTSIDPESALKAPEEVGIGTGVVYKIDKSLAYILTNYHVVGKANTIEVTYGEQKEKAKMIGYDAWTDMAVLTIPKGKLKTTIEMADSKDLQPGQQVLAMGSPLGQVFAGSVSSGIISGLSRNVPVDIDGDQIYDWEMNVLQTDAAINPGNSGGPLLNEQGKMIGLNSMKISMTGVEGIAFSIPSNDVKKVLKVLEEKGSIKRPKMGIMIEDIGTHRDPNDPNSPTDQPGVEIMDVEPNSLAEKSGLMVGDRVKAIDGKTVKSKIHFRKILFYENKIGDTITITYERNGVKKEVKVKL